MARTMHDYSAFAGLPDHTIHGRQFLYAVEFCSGVVKIGRTWNPQGRMRALTVHHHRVDGKRIVRVAVAQTHRWSTQNEAELITRLCRIAKPMRGSREYFAHCRFGQAVTLMRQIAAREMVTASAYVQGQRGSPMWFPRRRSTDTSAKAGA